MIALSSLVSTLLVSGFRKTDTPAQPCTLLIDPSTHLAPRRAKLDRTIQDMQIHIFRGPGRVFGCTEDATGVKLPSHFAPWSAFKSVELSRDGEPTPGVDTDQCLDDIEK